MADPELAARERREYLSKEAAPYAATIIERVIKNREPCVLVLPTGAGKSTVIPYAFVQAGYRVMIAEPTVVMCANVVSSFHAMFPSVSVGRAFGREVDVPKDARLIVVSNGYLKKRLLGTVKTGGICTSIEFTDILMLDEVHMGALDTHIIVSIWYYCSIKFATTARMPRLLLSSATVGDELYSRRFSPCVVLPAEKLTKTPYEITIKWSEKDYSISDAARYTDMGSLLRSLHETRPISERILLFLPGQQEMNKTLIASGLRMDVDATLVRLWSESVEEDYKPIERTEDPIRLVVFATPSADAGLTIVGLAHVIDSLLIKNSHVLPNGSEDLVPEVASRQLSRQRMGRVGRKAPGHYYPMCTETFYNSSAMPSSYTLEIQRRPLYTDIVELVSHGIQAEEVLSIYNIPTLQSSIDQLLNWGLLRRSDKSKELYPSSGGNFMTQTQLASPRLAGVLYAWVRVDQSVAEGVILIHLIASVTSQILQIRLPDVKPEDGRGAIEKQKVQFIRQHYARFQGPSDIHTAIRIWNTMIAETSSSKKPGDFASIENWCVVNAIQWRGLKNVIKSIQKTIPAIQREAVRLAAIDRSEVVTESTRDTLDWTINEHSAIPILRRLMEHVYQDQTATRSGDGRVVYVMKDGSTIEPERNTGFTLQSDPDSATQYPKRIVVVGQRTNAAGKTTLSQFLDIDNASGIASMSTEYLNSRLGIFVSGSRRRTR